MSDTFTWQEDTLPLSRTSYTTRLQTQARDESADKGHDVGAFVAIVEHHTLTYYRATCTWHGCEAWVDVRPDALVQAGQQTISGVAPAAWCRGGDVSGDQR
jgi:hypothetical protein